LPSPTQSTNEIWLTGNFNHKLNKSVTLTNDSALAVQQKALDYFKAQSFTSYSEIQGEGSMIPLLLILKDYSPGKKMSAPGQLCLTFDVSVKYSQCISVQIGQVHRSGLLYLLGYLIKYAI
jgi:hypothetical protein